MRNTALLDGLTHVGEANGGGGRHAGSFGQLVFLKSVGEAAQIVLALPTQPQPQIDLNLGLHRPASRPEAFLSRDLR